MLFNSHIFLFVFLPVTLLGYWTLNGLRRTRLGLAWLFLASLFFYSWWNLAYLPLLLASMGVNLLLSRLILRLRNKTESGALSALWVGLAFNLGLLAYFKYAKFLLETAATLTGWGFPSHEITLPLAVSFFSIQQIVFLVDTFQGLCPRGSALNYFTYVSFFPHLIAGPIVLHNELIPQLDRPRAKVFSSANAAMGLLLLSIGLIKKVLIADCLAIWVKLGFGQSASLSFCDAWFASLSYTLQLYFDFSGYSDMAIGLGLLFNLQLPTNFRSPYQATSIIVFWQNWHITLSRFITAYLYTPILRSLPKITFANSMLATLAAMLIAGLWHGADWRFVVFGAMHGLGIVANHIWRRNKFKMSDALGWLATMFWVNLALVIFRAPNWSTVKNMLAGMFGPATIAPTSWEPAPGILICFALVLLAPNTETIQATVQVTKKRWAVITGLALACSLVILEFQNPSEFLYFKF